MIKAIDTHLILSGISSRKDGSLRLSFETPELLSEQKIAFMEIQNKNIHAVLSPLDIPEVGIEVINKEIGNKTQSARIRSVLYVLFEQNNEEKTWEQFYQDRTEKIIDFLKSKIDS